MDLKLDRTNHQGFRSDFLEWGPPTRKGLNGVLDINNVSKEFKGLLALNHVSFNVRQGQIKALIGPNGAGKTTLFNVISGLLTSTLGEIYFKDIKITGLKKHEICRLGLGRTFQIPRLFGQITTLENVKVGCHPRTKSEIFSCGLKTPFCRREAKEIENRSLEILHILGLEGRRNTLAENLPVGEQKMLEIGRALATSPSLMLLDEPVAGLNDPETERLAQMILTLRNDLNITILLVEHDMNLVMEVADEIVVLNHGEKIAEGNPREIQNSEEVIMAYLGKGFSY